MEGQISSERYYSSCRRLENFIPNILGPATNRPGFQYIAAAKYTDRNTRLIPFDFSTEQSYMLEFGDQYIRFFKDKGQIISGQDAYTKVLLHCNGLDGGTTFTDEIGKTVTAVGNAQLNTAISKFGSASALFDGTGDYLTLADHADFDFSAGLWTVDTWIYIANTAIEENGGSLFSHAVDSGNYIRGYKTTTVVPADSYTKLLLHCNGIDGSTQVKDETGKLMWANAGLHLSTAKPKFGTAALQFDGIDDYLATNDHADFDLSGGIWTFDTQIYFNAQAPYDGTIFSQATDANNWIRLNIEHTTSYYHTLTLVICIAGVSTTIYGPTGYRANGWHHIEIVEDSNNWYIYIDGTCILTAINTVRAANYTGPFTIGGFNPNGTPVIDFYTGYLDEIRLSVGVARHTGTSPFTPPTEEYTYAASYTHSFGLHLREAATLKIVIASVAEALSTGWHHIAYVEDSNNWYIFVDGNEAATTTNGNRAANYTRPFVIAAYDNGIISDYLPHSLDEIRVSNGVARWTADFIPPTVEYTIAPGGTIYEVSTPYTQADVNYLQYAQSNDILYLVHPNYAPRKLERTGHASWTLTTISFFQRYYPTASMITTVGFESGGSFSAEQCIDGQLTTKGFDISGDAANTYLQFDFGSGNTRELVKIALFISGEPLNGTFDIEYYDTVAVSWEPATTGWDLSSEPLGWIEKSWNSVGAFQKWRLIKTTGSTTGGDAMELELYEVGMPDSWTTGAYPSSVCFYEQRLWFAYNQTIWASKSGDFYNLSMGTDSDNALEYTIAAQEVNKIHWMHSGKVLSIGTAGGEYRVMSTSLDEAITPLNARISKQSSYGSAYIMAISIADVVFYLQRSNRKLREFSYNSLDDIFVSTDRSRIANHLFNSDIVSMAYQQEPYSILWCVTADGDLLGMTYDRLENTFAWHQHNTEGSFRSVATIYGTERGNNELWAIVDRTVNSATVKYIEVMAEPFVSTSLDSEDCFFVDSGLTYQGVPTTSITGLTHLEGKIVSILADGVNHPQQVVASGAITLDAEASIVHVGLPYNSILQTMRIEAADGTGTLQGRKKTIGKIIARIFKTKDFLYGSTINGSFGRAIMSDIMKPGGDDYGAWDYELDQIAGWDFDGHIVIVNDRPYPITITALIPNVRTS